MVVVVTSYGTSLRKRNGCLEITDREGKTNCFSPREVSAINLSVPCALTSEVISLCMEHDIGITMTSPKGMPLWQVTPFQGGSIPLLRRKQLLLSQRPEGGQMVKALLSQKLGRRMDLLRRLAANRRDERGRLLKERIEQIQSICERLTGLPSRPIADIRQTLLGYEGTAGRIYFSALAGLLPPEAEFQGRGRGMEAGGFNMMLNYGYGVLYQELFALCGKVKLDPYIGVMHTDAWNRPTLTYDLIEPFRADVEQAVFFLFSRRRIHMETHFDRTDSEGVLSRDGKRVLMESLRKVQKECKHTQMKELATKFANDLNAWKP